MLHCATMLQAIAIVVIDEERARERDVAALRE